MLLPSTSRKSRWPLDWSMAACLSAPEQSLDAQTGQSGSLVRASTTTALDANGATIHVAHSMPAVEWVLDTVTGLMLPGLRIGADTFTMAVSVTGTLYQRYWDDGSSAIVETVGAYTANAAIPFVSPHVYLVTRVGYGTLSAATMRVG